jgi:hypothetical protein
MKNIQQRFLTEILDKRGYVCSSKITQQHQTKTAVLCAVVLGLEEGTTIFTFDDNEFICRTYREADFSGCVFDACSSCKTYKFDELETTTTATAGKILQYRIMA